MSDPAPSNRPPENAPGPAPKRVRVTSPRHTAARPGPARHLGTELAEQTALGEVYVDTLIRQQRRAALVVLALVVVGVGMVAAIFAFVPAAQTTTLGPIPLTWIALGGFSYPLLLLAAIGYLRSAERTERDFAGWRRRD